MLTPGQLVASSPFLLPASGEGGTQGGTRGGGQGGGGGGPSAEKPHSTERLRSPPPSATLPAFAESPSFRYLLSFVGSVRLKNRGYSFGVRQKIFRAFVDHPGFLLRDLRGASYNAMPKAQYFEVLQTSKFCLAPSGMGFSTRVYETIAQGCVPLIIQDEPDSKTDVEQAVL